MGGDLGSLGCAQAMPCIPLSWEGSVGASITSCCWAGQRWFLELAGSLGANARKGKTQ